MKRMHKEEQDYWKKYLSNNQYDYAITITERDSDGVGSVYLSALEWMERVVQKDPTAKAVVVISAAETDHSHAHGVIKTSMPQRGVRSCSRGCWIHTQCLYDAVGWYEYMLGQGASQATITSEELISVQGVTL